MMQNTFWAKGLFYSIINNANEGRFQIDWIRIEIFECTKFMRRNIYVWNLHTVLCLCIHINVTFACNGVELTSFAKNFMHKLKALLQYFCMWFSRKRCAVKRQTIAVKMQSLQIFAMTQMFYSSLRAKACIFCQLQ